MKTRKLVFSLLLYQSILTVLGQTSTLQTDTSKYEFAILRFSTGLSYGLEVIFENKPYIDLKTQLNIKNLPESNYPYEEDKYIFAGFKYMQENGYELISSTATDLNQGTYHIKEYYYRRKMKSK